MLPTTRTTVTVCRTIVAAGLAAALLVQPLTVWAYTGNCSPGGQSRDASRVDCSCCCAEEPQAECCCCTTVTPPVKTRSSADQPAAGGWHSASAENVLLWRSSCRCSISESPFSRYDQRRDDGRLTEHLVSSLDRLSIAHSVPRTRSVTRGLHSQGGCAPSVQCLLCVWRI